MTPLIDQELENTDSKHNELWSLNQKLTDAFQLYTRLMKEATIAPQQYPTSVGYVGQTQQPAQPGATTYLSHHSAAEQASMSLPYPVQHDTQNQVH